MLFRGRTRPPGRPPGRSERACAGRCRTPEQPARQNRVGSARVDERLDRLEALSPGVSDIEAHTERAHAAVIAASRRLRKWPRWTSGRFDPARPRAPVSTVRSVRLRQAATLAGWSTGIARSPTSRESEREPTRIRLLRVTEPPTQRSTTCRRRFVSSMNRSEPRTARSRCGRGSIGPVEPSGRLGSGGARSYRTSGRPPAWPRGTWARSSLRPGSGGGDDRPVTSHFALGADGRFYRNQADEHGPDPGGVGRRREFRGSLVPGVDVETWAPELLGLIRKALS